jgi:cytochrome c peroxidase
MHRTSKLVAGLLLGAVLLLLPDCKHDPAVTQTPADPDSLYVGTPYTFADHSVQGGGQYRKVVSPADNPTTYEGVQLGRMLFYDSTISLNKRVSCGSCHKQEYAFGDNQVHSVNVHGPTKRNASALMNLGVNKIFFWDGRQATLEDAVNDALTHEQDPDFTATFKYLDTTANYKYLFKKAFGRPGDITQDKMVKAIAQFVRTLRSEDSKFDKYMNGQRNLLSASELNGYNIFLDQQLGDCTHCHSDAPYLTFANQQNPMRNNALDSVADANDFGDKGYGGFTMNSYDNGKFKIATLRNVEVTGPYMHDGRFTTLEQIADHYGTRDSLKMSPTVDPLMERFVKPIPDLDPQQKADLVAFLKTLTDTAFLHNPAFSNPFHH